MINFEMTAQPDDESCGPSSLHAIYKYYNFNITYDEITQNIERSLSGGTLAPLLGKHALQMGFKVTLYTNNLNIFDPSWFNHDEASPRLLREKLMEQLRYKKNRFLARATHAFLDFLTLGGEVNLHIINIELIEHYFARKIPILTGLSSTYLYGAKRERFDKGGNAISDDIRGAPCGHFVVLYGHEKNEKLITVADPYAKNPLSKDHYYKVSSDRLINAIMLGVSTYDGNLLIIEPK
ncbi:MAG: cysteine peptidase family C39 domain-containing protein [Legionella sp.]|nr:cysteine peptidase family C39 domain-containing protein [Legionella sp.]